MATAEDIIDERMKACEDLADRFMEDLNDPNKMSFREQLVTLALAATFVGQAIGLKREASSDPAERTELCGAR